MIIRVQAPEGMKKFTIEDGDSVEKLLNMVSGGFKLDRRGNWYLSKSRDENGRFTFDSNCVLSKLGLKHGELLYLIDKGSINTLGPSNATNPLTKSLGNEHNGLLKGSRNSVKPEYKPAFNVGEDKVDQLLLKMDGKIHRKRSNQLCHHPPSGQCIHCVPLEPYDSAYLEMLDPPVKFMSFHAYLRKLSGGTGKGKFVSLENPSYRVRPGCREHPPWPEGICTKCQPNPMTLERQVYRHVDYVQFENRQIMETFLDFWRHTGHQRIGLMLGRYELFETAGAPPLAIQAVVVAIYEPLQESTFRSVRLTAPLNALMSPEAMEVANRLGLRPVGWIFTDLVPEEATNSGQVKHFRGTVDTFFMSAEECVTAARLQNLHPNICSLSPDGKFGSKFVTVVVTGDSSKQIHFEAYQVSNQAMALERDGLLIPTYDAPELGYIRETTKQQFVPEVFYSKKDKYGNVVTHVARPLPVEFLLVEIPVAFPISPKYTMAQLADGQTAEQRFPVANRESLGQVQDFAAFTRHLNTIGSGGLRTALVNFHLLAWLAANKTLPLTLHQTDGGGGVASWNEAPHSLAGLVAAIASTEGNPSGQAAAIDKWAADSPAWATVMMLMQSDMPSPTTARATSTPGRKPVSSQTPSDDAEMPEAANHWSCPHCTYHNSLQARECEMCGLPQHG